MSTSQMKSNMKKNPSLDENFQEGFFTVIKTVVKESKTGKKIEGYALAELVISNGKPCLDVVEEDRCSYFGIGYPLTKKQHQSFIDESQGYIFDCEAIEKLYLVSYDAFFMRLC
jgi:hypothetical protein